MVFALISSSAFAQFTQAPLPYAYNALEPFLYAMFFYRVIL